MRKLPVRLAHLASVWASYAAAPPSWERARDRVLQAVAHQGLLRKRELRALRAEDVLVFWGAGGDALAVRLRVVEPKLAPRASAHATLAARADDFDAVGPLLAWLHAAGCFVGGRVVAGRERDLLFPSEPGGAVPVAAASIVAALRDGFAALGYASETPELGCSLRAGGEQDLLASGVSMAEVRRLKRHRAIGEAYFDPACVPIAHDCAELRKLRLVALDVVPGGGPITA